MRTTTEAWERVEDAVSKAHSIAWDGCHKIYVLMDEGETAVMTDYGYRENVPGGSWLLLVTEVDSPFDTLRDWWFDSCGLRFISAVKTVEGNRNDGFTGLIEQFESDDSEEEDE